MSDVANQEGAPLIDIVSRRESGYISKENQQNRKDIPKIAHPAKSPGTTPLQMAQSELASPGPNYTSNPESYRMGNTQTAKHVNKLKEQQEPDNKISSEQDNIKSDVPSCAAWGVTTSTNERINVTTTAKKLNERTTLEKSLIRTTDRGLQDDDQETKDVRSPDQATEPGEWKDKRSSDKLVKVPSAGEDKEISTQKTGGTADAPNSNGIFHDDSTTVFLQTLGTAYQAVDNARIDQKAGKACDKTSKLRDDQNHKNEWRRHATDDTGDNKPISEWFGDIAAYMNEDYKIRGETKGKDIQQTTLKSN